MNNSSIPVVIYESGNKYPSTIIKMHLCLKSWLMIGYVYRLSFCRQMSGQIQEHTDQGHKAWLFMHMFNFIFVLFKYTPIYDSNGGQ